MDQAELIADFPVLARLSAGELARLSGGARTIQFDARERVFSEGQRYGGTSHDQPSTSPAPRVCTTTRPRPGMNTSSATRP